MEMDIKTVARSHAGLSSGHLKLLDEIASLQRKNAALLVIFRAAKAFTDYKREGAALGWPHWHSKFDALKSAVDDARKDKP
jgi:hypothetical protein